MLPVPNILFIRHLPSSLSTNEKEDLMKHFGAKVVRFMPDYGRMRNSCFAEFASKEEAELALARLHQLEVLNCRLIVQYADTEESISVPNESDFKRMKPEQQDEAKKQQRDKKEALFEKVEEFKKRLNAVAPEFGMNYPFNSSLKYKYPPPTPSIITNIAHALATIPKFYTQVLHLMNKMNIPAPFGLITMTPLLAPDPPNLIGLTKITEPDSYVEQEMDIMSEEESEVESESESTNLVNQEKKAVKRPTKRINKQMKKPRLQQLINTVQQTDGFTKGKVAEPSEVFETVEMDSKKIQFNINPTEVPEIEQVIATPVEGGGFGTIEPQKASNEKEEKSEEANEEMWRGVRFIGSHELERNRISSKEMKSQSVFKNYEPGEPTYRLYVKNLAKQVNEKDLLGIYGRYINRKLENEKNMFDIRLMKEGRMKGQAFVTLPNEDQATKALKDTHGYMLHGKPILVQFARSARPKGNEEKKQTKRQ